MKYRSLLATAVVGTLLIGATYLPEAPPRIDYVATDATWVIHLDVEGLLESTVGEWLIEQGLLDQLGELEEETGLDLMTDIKQITAYGDCFDDGPEVIVALTTDAIDGLVERLAEEEESYYQTTVAGHECHGWDDGIGHIRDLRGGNRLVVLAENKERLARAMSVIDGDGPGASVADLARLDAPTDGAFLFALFGDMGFLGDDQPFSAITNRAGATKLMIGERDGELFADARVNTRDAGVADELVEAGEGLLELGRMLAEDEDADISGLGAILDGLRLESDGDTLSIRIRIDLEQVVFEFHDKSGCSG